VATRKPITQLLVSAVVVLSLTACDTSGNSERRSSEGDPVPTHNGAAKADKRGDGTLRTDAAPLTSRFSVLGEPPEAFWMAGTYGDPRVPGPSTYWIDAVVTLSADRVDALVTEHSPEPTNEAPDVVDAMVQYLPPGPFHTSEALDDAFNEGRWWARVYLDPYASKLVLVATGT
jgi:hypothetical protein